jgi:hypothetical protein
MARKLLCLVALISLVLLIKAPPGFAYSLNLGNLSYATWIEVHGQGGESYPGDTNGSISLFDLYGLVNNGQPQYRLVPLSNPNPGKIISTDDNWVTYQIVYTLRQDNSDPEMPTFHAENYYGPTIDANLIVITTTATYAKDPDTGLPLYAPDSPGGDYHYTLQDSTMYLTGYGQNSDGTWFSLEGIMIEVNTNTQHSGYFSSLTLNYDVPPPSQTPIPGAVWLLGTGLLGLACVGRRRKK